MPKISGYTVIAFVAASFAISGSRALGDLPLIGAEQLRDAVVLHDALYPNQRASYTIVETSDRRIDPRSPVKRVGAYRFCRENGKYFYDVNLDVAGQPRWFCQQSFDGQRRMQYFSGQKTGDLFRDYYDPGWPSPLSFGLTAGNRDVMLGAAIALGKINSIKVSEWMGHNVYLVNWIDNGVQRLAWVDPAAGWRAQHMEIFSNHMSGPICEITTNFQKLPNDVWYPVSGVIKSYYEGALTGNNCVIATTTTLDVTHAEVGFPSTARDFSIEFPDGTAVFDHVANMGFVVGTGSIAGVPEGVLDKIATAALVSSHDVESGSNAGSAAGVFRGVILGITFTLLAIAVIGYAVARATRRSRFTM